jgi:predicted DNA-binding transcriptional regulator YafY
VSGAGLNMPKSSNQKLKLLYLLRILQKETDEEHYLNSQQLIERLEKYDISAERKSIYDDIARLTDFGYDIIHVKTKGGSGYYMGSREFELAELKLLVDVVQASRFITLRKSRELINKLEQFVSGKEAQQLQRQVYVAGRVKTDNESIYYNVDFIHRAIQENRQISFQYMEWTLDKKLVPRKGGARYVISPWALSWNDENYYLIGYDKEADLMKHYRVDKMGSIGLTREERQGSSVFENFDIAVYTNKTFGMYGGREEIVSLVFADQLIGVVLDRFGRETDIRRLQEGTFRVRVKVAVSGQFFGWLTGLGTQVRLAGPENVVEEYRNYLKKIYDRYEEGCSGQ